MLSTSWTLKRSRITIWSLEQQTACRVFSLKYLYQLQFQVIRFRINCDKEKDKNFSTINPSSLVILADVNDNPPTLPQDNYEVTVSESAPFGSVILKVAAQDADGPGEKNFKFPFV